MLIKIKLFYISLLISLSPINNFKKLINYILKIILYSYNPRLLFSFFISFIYSILRRSLLDNFIKIIL